MTLYLKYRPQKLEELDLVAVRESLKKILASDETPHAFLFSGPKGTGKTSAARILAKVINCDEKGRNRKKAVEPCNKCSECVSITRGENLDVIELDAASHRGIDDIRALRDTIKLSPLHSKKKIYIIDEAHMLTTEASNALLKTLEEPPDHVLFVLATTNPEKLIATVRSRSTLIQFNKASIQELVNSLKRVVYGEKIDVNEVALGLIAKESDGSFRDAVKILEQLILQEKKLNEESVSEFLFSKKSFDVNKFLNLLHKRQAKEVLFMVENALAMGSSTEAIIKIILSTLRKSLLAKVGVGEDMLNLFKKEELVQLIELLMDAESKSKTAYIEQVPLEILVIKWCQTSSKDAEDKKKVEIPKVTPSSLPKREASVVGDNLSTIENGQKYTGDTISDDIWSNTLLLLRQRNTSTEALLRAAHPLSYDGKSLSLAVYYSFHKERLESAPHRDLLENTLGEVLGGRVRVSFILTNPPAVAKTNDMVVLTEEKDEDIMKVAKEIFGS